MSQVNRIMSEIFDLNVGDQCRVIAIGRVNSPDDADILVGGFALEIADAKNPSCIRARWSVAEGCSPYFVAVIHVAETTCMSVTRSGGVSLERRSWGCALGRQHSQRLVANLRQHFRRRETAWRQCPRHVGAHRSKLSGGLWLQC